KKMIVVSDYNQILSNPRESGDEPCMIADSLPGIPVIVGADRILTGKYAVENFNPNIILLDDGFQRWSLERDCDIVCVDSQKPLNQLRLFPRGSLRESIQGLKRAQAVILTRTENAAAAQKQEALIHGITGGIPIIRMRYILGESLPISDIETEEITPEILERKRVLLFCGLANPDSFFTLAEKQFRHVEKKIAFPDHVSYSDEHIRQIKSEFVYYNCDLAFTTEKDAVKLKAKGIPRMPIYYFTLHTEFEDDTDHTRFLSLLLESKK
ncbi:tetraacyldisaccharide 4'-kinase, partial [Candidatus Sumerlaeota bacterium]|nr:tetraacyldisaccharide 4'-kinase [Candidatus Sumerlaeota bacterium]